MKARLRAPLGRVIHCARRRAAPAVDGGFGRANGRSTGVDEWRA
ncbi:MAG: hypothetical protein U0470_05645 [Anaerolineae bacterium]